MARFSGGSGGGSGVPGPRGPAGPQGPVGPQGPAGDGGGPKEWTSPAEGLYQILQAHGGVEVQTESQQFWSESAIVTESNLGSNTINIAVTTELNAILLDIVNGVKHFRSLSLDINGQRFFRINYLVSENVWNISLETGAVTVQANNGYWLELRYDGAPVIWWDIATLGLLPEGDEWKFRGAKIDYHAYATDSGTIIGTIYMARDAGDNYLTHIETGSGGNDLGTVSLWYRGNGSNETSLQMYRQDGESSTTRIHWTAQVYVGTEFWDD